MWALGTAKSSANYEHLSHCCLSSLCCQLIKEQGTIWKWNSFMSANFIFKNLLFLSY